MVRLRVSEADRGNHLIRDFNSNMVRLREYDWLLVWSDETKFQFQYGAIKRISDETRLQLMTLFQFQYGAIKSTLRNRSGFNLPQFQFQYGAIKSGEIFSRHRFRKKFQFQYGAIKRVSFLNAIQPLEYFNSNMVRLRVAEYINQAPSLNRISIPIWCD